MSLIVRDSCFTFRRRLPALPPSLAPALCLLLLLAPLPGRAVGLGDVLVSSHLGAPLRAEIPVTGVAAGPLAGECRTAVSPVPDSGLPVPPGLRLRVAPDAPRLLLRSPAAVREPAVSFAVEIECAGSGRIRRGYTVLLDPFIPPRRRAASVRMTPATAAGEPAPAAPEPGAVRSARAPGPAPAPTPASPPSPAALPDLPAPGAGEVRVRPGDTVSSLLRRLAPEAARDDLWGAVARVVQANPVVFPTGDADRLPAGVVLRIPDLSAPAPAPPPQDAAQEAAQDAASAVARAGTVSAAGDGAGAQPPEPAAADAAGEAPEEGASAPGSAPAGGSLRILTAAEEAAAEPLELASTARLAPGPASAGGGESAPRPEAAPPRVRPPRLEETPAPAPGEAPAAEPDAAAPDARVLELESQLALLREEMARLRDDLGREPPRPVAAPAGSGDDWRWWAAAVALLSLLVAVLVWLLLRSRRTRPETVFPESAPATVVPVPDARTEPAPHPASPLSGARPGPLGSGPSEPGRLQPGPPEPASSAVPPPPAAATDAEESTLRLRPVDLEEEGTVRFEAGGLAFRERRAGDQAIPAPGDPVAAPGTESDVDTDPDFDWPGLEESPVSPEAAAATAVGTGRRLKSMSSALLEVELHLLYEQYGEAASLLETLVHRDLGSDNPDMRPWSMLFSVYRQQGDEAAFEGLTQRFREHYNVVAPRWDAPPQPPETLGLEAKFPRVAEKLTVVWNEPDAAAFLNALLLDDRGGIRQGFELDVAEELSFLRDLYLLRTELSPG